MKPEGSLREPRKGAYCTGTSLLEALCRAEASVLETVGEAERGLHGKKLIGLPGATEETKLEIKLGWEGTAGEA